MVSMVCMMSVECYLNCSKLMTQTIEAIADQWSDTHYIVIQNTLTRMPWIPNCLSTTASIILVQSAKCDKLINLSWAFSLSDPTIQLFVFMHISIYYIKMYTQNNCIKTNGEKSNVLLFIESFYTIWSVRSCGLWPVICALVITNVSFLPQ